MAYPIEKKLVVAVSSRAIFDMEAANAIFEIEGADAYKAYQAKKLDEPFMPGVAFPFVRRLLRLNELYPEQQPVEVIVLSRNDPASGERFFRSCKHYGLRISRGAFLSGNSPYQYIPAFNASIFLSANKVDVMSAIDAGSPAGLVLPSAAIEDFEDHELRIAFDFDGVLADDKSEAIYRKSGNDLDTFFRYEAIRAEVPHNPGPLKDLFTKIGYFQKLEARRAQTELGYRPAVRISIVTARNAPAEERVVTTLKSWGMSATEIFLLGGIEKKRVLEILRPHIFFDDQRVHLEATAATVPSVLIPFGVANAVALADGPEEILRPAVDEADRAGEPTTESRR